MGHHLRIVPPRDIITPALNKGGKSAPARLLITKLELYPHKPRQIFTRTCNLIFLLELFPSNPRTFARPRDIITHALAHKWGNALSRRPTAWLHTPNYQPMRLRWSGETFAGLIFAQPQTTPQPLELFPHKLRQLLMRAYNLVIF